eukprot:364344-Chlamydomonas_euryale.AAC.18
MAGPSLSSRYDQGVQRGDLSHVPSWFRKSWHGGRAVIYRHQKPCMRHALCQRMQDSDKKSRVTGVEAVRASILAAKTVSRTLKSSLGPKGMDKMLQSPDGDITISECRVMRLARCFE